MIEQLTTNLTELDWFAGMALPAVIEITEQERKAMVASKPPSLNERAKSAASVAYAYAAGMLAERAKVMQRAAEAAAEAKKT